MKIMKSITDELVKLSNLINVEKKEIEMIVNSQYLKCLKIL